MIQNKTIVPIKYCQLVSLTNDKAKEGFHTVIFASSVQQVNYY